tara:strand:+ start:463 stop:624 length:162 start_codon:yes stop_codon:yes gene_type:complete
VDNTTLLENRIAFGFSKVQHIETNLTVFYLIKTIVNLNWKTINAIGIFQMNHG